MTALAGSPTGSRKVAGPTVKVPQLLAAGVSRRYCADMSSAATPELRGVWSVRLAEERDARAVAALAREFADANPSASASAGSDLARATEAAESVIANGGVEVLVAESDGGVGGVLTMVDMPSLVHGGRVSTFIDLLVVSNGVRRRGVGTTLVQVALERARARGAYKVSLYFHDRNDPARQLYASMGLRPTGEAHAMYLT